MLDRRIFLTSTLTAMAVLPGTNSANAKVFVGIAKRKIGDIMVTALLDGVATFGTAGDTAINAHLIEIGNRKILVDGGMSSTYGTRNGNLLAAIKLAGVTPEEIDTLFCTHMHPDHVASFVTKYRGVEPTFSNAELVLHKNENTFWRHPPANVANFAPDALAVLSAYADRTRLVPDKVEIASGITVKYLPGHTPGHSGLIVSSGDETLLLWADLIVSGERQFADPEWNHTFDNDHSQATETRKSVLEMASREKLEIGGSHLNFPSFGRVEKLASGYKFHPWSIP